MKSTTKFNVVIAIYYDLFLIVVANEIGYVCFFLTVINFGLVAFGFELPFYIAGINILSSINLSSINLTWKDSF